MKTSILAITLWSLFFVSVFAEELPVLWLEAGKTETCHVYSEGAWKLRYGHRILDGGTARILQPALQTRNPAILKLTLPPLKPGVRIQTELLLDDKPVYKIVIAAPDPFEDREHWFAAHPISLYDPEGKTAETLKNEGIPFTRLSSFENIIAVKSGVLLVGEDVDFEATKGLSEILFEKAGEGRRILVAAPKGKVSLDFKPEIVSFLLADDEHYLFPDRSRRNPEIAWVLSAETSRLMLTEATLTQENFKGAHCGPTILDVRFPDPWKNVAQTRGRIVFDKRFQPSRWKHSVETRYYFKSLIEKLSEKGESQ